MAKLHWEEIRAFLDDEVVRDVEGRLREDKDEADEEPGDAEEEEGEEPKQTEPAEPAEPATKPYSKALDKAADAAPDTVRAVALSNPVTAVAGWLDTLHAKAKQPGSVLPLVFVLLFFIFAIVPVNGGATRFELIWRALTGGADLPPSLARQELAAQYADIAEQQHEVDVARSIAWGTMWGVGGTLAGG